MNNASAAACVLSLLLASMPATNAASLDDAAERYRPYLIEGIGQALTGARDLRERIAAKDLAGAKKAWISARAGWERSEVFTAGFVPELDSQIDAWPNADSGFHAIEAKLFGAGRTDVAGETDALVDHLDSLHGKLRDMPLTPQGLLDGTVRLAYEVGESKADGGESRISGTSLDDMRNNVAGIDFAYRTIFAAALEAADGKLAGAVDAKDRTTEDDRCRARFATRRYCRAATQQRGTGGHAAGRLEQTRVAAVHAGGRFAMNVRRVGISARCIRPAARWRLRARHGLSG